MQQAQLAETLYPLFLKMDNHCSEWGYKLAANKAYDAAVVYFDVILERIRNGREANGRDSPGDSQAADSQAIQV